LWGQREWRNPRGVIVWRDHVRFLSSGWLLEVKYSEAEMAKQSEQIWQYAFRGSSSIRAVFWINRS